MPKGRIYLSVDLVNEELKKKLMDMVIEDIAIHGEATPSTLVRNLIRDEWNRRHPPAPQVVPDLTDEQWKQLRKKLAIGFSCGGDVLMARGFHYRVHRCYICQHEAVSTDSDGRSVCAVHLEKNYEDRAFEESTRIIDLVGREEYNRLLDVRFPGDDATTTFPSKDYYEWAKAKREELEREASSRSQNQSSNG